ncbi:hypothetical protein ASG75_12830 [Rhodanobacter sp. Soil772]|nr:hypothetical protein ASG75_12830 [Rhodanobacter sp. Soil772]
MGVQRLGRDTTSVDSLVWNGHGFDGAEAQSMWWQLPETLKQVAIAELQAGNIPEHILRNDTRAIVLLAFQRRPMTPKPSAEVIRVHPSFAYGNYCYDGTFCTYEDIESGCFLAFDDPDYVDAL